MHTMKPAASCLLALLLVVVAPQGVPQQPPAPPQAPVYHIELIVFRANAALGAAENWAAQPGLRALGAAAESDESAGPNGQLARLVGLLPPTQYQLNDIAAKLRASGGYDPVAHVAWAQTASPWGTRAGFSLERLGVEVPGLTGMVFLERGQFLHLGMTLSYAMPSPPPGLAAGPGTTFTLNESRRVRFYERNYYDHPAFGAIALVTPAQGRRPGR